MIEKKLVLKKSTIPWFCGDDSLPGDIELNRVYHYTIRGDHNFELNKKIDLIGATTDPLGPLNKKINHLIGKVLIISAEKYKHNYQTYTQGFYQVVSLKKSR